jgi:hypothetical protein
MNVQRDLIGKTITGVVATPDADGGVREIWMLQFSDGTHVEFVSPGARKGLRRTVNNRNGLKTRPQNDLQLALNVA